MLTAFIDHISPSPVLWKRATKAAAITTALFAFNWIFQINLIGPARILSMYFLVVCVLIVGTTWATTLSRHADGETKRRHGGAVSLPCSGLAIALLCIYGFAGGAWFVLTAFFMGCYEIGIRIKPVTYPGRLPF